MGVVVLCGTVLRVRMSRDVVQVGGDLKADLCRGLGFVAGGTVCILYSHRRANRIDRILSFPGIR